ASVSGKNSKIAFRGIGMAVHCDFTTQNKRGPCVKRLDCCHDDRQAAKLLPGRRNAVRRVMISDFSRAGAEIYL
ncbi:MAG TPA: hypothetical protein VN281_17595, partial [Verrucomicrobiae bacterium]|nr:hypothetical protein [Verrucomicrobiae bacterium]